MPSAAATVGVVPTAGAASAMGMVATAAMVIVTTVATVMAEVATAGHGEAWTRRARTAVVTAVAATATVVTADTATVDTATVDTVEVVTTTERRRRGGRESAVREQRPRCARRARSGKHETFGVLRLGTDLLHRRARNSFGRNRSRGKAGDFGRW